MHKSSLLSTPPGLIALGILAIAAFCWEMPLAAALLLFLLLIHAGAFIWSRNALKSMEISIDDGQSACHAGDTLSLRFRIRNHSFFPLVWLNVLLPLGASNTLCRVGDHASTLYRMPPEKPFYGCLTRFAWLLWQQETVCTAEFQAVHRGIVSVEKASLQAGDAIGLGACQRWAMLKRPVRLIVYPKLTPVDVSPFLRLISDVDTGTKGQTEDITLLRSSRPYQHGDPMKRINWRYLAMTGRMEVNQYETITPGCITFLLDLGSFREIRQVRESDNSIHIRFFLREKELESMISLIASCIHALAAQQLRFALIIPGYAQQEPIVCRPGSGDDAIAQAMEALAGVAYQNETSILPSEEIRRLRRKLGVIHICSWSDASAVLDMLGNLGCSRLRCIACTKSEQSDSAKAPNCLMLEDIAFEHAAEGGV